jgi:hypothetical protein
MADEGLFGGMKFLDLAIPAAGAIASAYNPYVGYGLQTGMNMFNTMAGFQSNLRQWKRISEEDKRRQAGIDELKRTLASHGEYLAGDTAQEIDKVTRNYKQGVDQMPAQAAFPSGIGFGPMPDVRENKFSQLIPDKVAQVAIDDEGVRAAKNREEMVRVAGGMANLTPEIASQLTSVLGQQSYGAQTNLDYIDAAFKANEQADLRKFKLGQLEKAGLLDDYKAKELEKRETQRLANEGWRQTAIDIHDATQGTGFDSYNDLQQLNLRAQKNYEEIEIMLRGLEGSDELLEMMQANLRHLQRMVDLAAVKAGLDVPPKDPKDPKDPDDERPGGALFVKTGITPQPRAG